MSQNGKKEITKGKEQRYMNIEIPREAYYLTVFYGCIGFILNRFQTIYYYIFSSRENEN